MKKKAWKPIVWIVGIVVVVAILGNVISGQVLRSVTRHLVFKQTGFDLTVGKVSSSLWKRELTLEDVVLQNPGDYPSAEALEIERLYVRYKPLSFLSDTAEIPVLELHVPRISVVRMPSGKINLQELAERAQQAASPTGANMPIETADSSADAGASKLEDIEDVAADMVEESNAKADDQKTSEMGFYIGVLRLRIDQVRMLQYTEGTPEPRIDVLPIAIDRTYYDVNNLDQLNELLTKEILQSGSRLLIGDLLKGLEDNDDDVEQTFKDIGNKLGNFLGGLK